MKTIDISRDFSKVPAGRFITDGDFSGEIFRDKLLVPALHEYDKVQIILDNTAGYGSSFLEEAFGGLIRYCGFTKSYLDDHLSLIATSTRAKRYPPRISSYINDAVVSPDKSHGYRRHISGKKS
ncbi:STAS-like domain-containing protein [Stenotrophomonas maltophilia]|nr:STAS-like domain-containing protein [Stenotrophomonas maltophilia]MBH1544551.1 STAS-like domain-containing protein [Stenotrophomonas maltophilia]